MGDDGGDDVECGEDMVCGESGDGSGGVEVGLDPNSCMVELGTAALFLLSLVPELEGNCGDHGADDSLICSLRSSRRTWTWSSMS